jgi:hypothetical protein
MRTATIGILLTGLAVSLNAGAFTASQDICQNNGCATTGASYNGPTSGFGDSSGASADGGNDAFDTYGYLYQHRSNPYRPHERPCDHQPDRRLFREPWIG